MATNDRIDSQAGGDKLPKPEVKIIVKGQSVFKPGMKTYFVDDGHSGEVFGSEGKVVVGGTVCTCDAVCTCESHHVCTCNSQCSCQNHRICTCNSQCTCQNHSTGMCSCNKVCTCVPVH